MLKAKVIPRVLSQAHVDGIESSLLLREDGSLLGSAGLLSHNASKEAHVVAAILSSVWADYEGTGLQLDSGPLKVVQIECEQGRVGSIRVGGQYIAAVCGKSCSAQVVKANLQRLHSALDPITKTFEPPRE
jgi:predicted regulator of Ras-like GTPase activity (Roadblock/LC7/MglB family)